MIFVKYWKSAKKYFLSGNFFVFVIYCTKRRCLQIELKWKMCAKRPFINNKKKEIC